MRSLVLEAVLVVRVKQLLLLPVQVELVQGYVKLCCAYQVSETYLSCTRGKSQTAEVCDATLCGSM